MKPALLVKLALLVGFVLLLFDGASVARAWYGADNEAQDVARAATDSYRTSNDVQTAYDAAVAALSDGQDTIDTKTFAFKPDGSVQLTLHRSASTVVLGKLKKSWTSVTAEGTANRPS